MSDAISLAATTVNAPDALELATFYAEITRGVAKAAFTGRSSTARTAHWGFSRLTTSAPGVAPR